MHLPALLFGVLLSSLYGTAFHWWRGGGAGRLLLYVGLAWLGFWLGHAAASWFGWIFASVGPLHVGMGTLCSFAALALGYWLSLLRPESKPIKRTKKL